MTPCQAPHLCSLSLSLLARQPLCFAQLSHGTAPRPSSAGGKPGTALPASAPGRSAATSPSRLQGGLVSLGESGMDKAGLFPGEGATFRLQKTNLPRCCAQPAGAVDVGCFDSPGGFFSTCHHPAPCAGVLGVGRDSSRQQGWRTDFPGRWSRLSCGCRSPHECNQSFHQSFVFPCTIQHGYQPHEGLS